MRKRTPGLVGGEPANLVQKTVRSFPLSLDLAGRIVLHEPAAGPAVECVRRAYERVELELLALEERCPRKASHRTLDAAEYHWMMMTDLMIEARIAVNELERHDALWSLKAGTSPLHSSDRLVVLG